jgi:hypothetical protein
MSPEKDLTFIVSGGRTGTQLFSHMLSEVVVNCFSVHEPDVFAGLKPRSIGRIWKFGIWHVLIGRLLNKTGTRVIGQKLICGEITAEQAKAYAKLSRSRYHQSIAKSLIIESNGQWWSMIDQLREVWPRAKVVVLVRDPRNWVRSWMNKTGRYDNRDWVSRLPPGRLTPEKVGDHEWIDQWPDLGTFGRLTWEWSFLNRWMLSAVDRTPNARIFRFEDVFEPDGKTLRELVEFATMHGERRYKLHEIEKLTRTVKNSSIGSAAHWHSWNREQVKLMDTICGPLMRQFDYGMEPEWQTLI